MANEPKQATTTLIRTIYSDSSYIVIKFYNTSLAFQFVPFQRKDETGKNIFDATRQLSTTVSQDSAFALYKFGSDIVQEKTQEGTLSITGNNSVITLERKFSPTGFETILSISKNGQTIPFKFATTTLSVKENGIFKTTQIESGLGAFTKMLEGYLSGINSDRHLNKLTDDYVKSLEEQKPAQPAQPQYKNNNYQKKQWQPNPQWQAKKQNYQFNQQPQTWESQNQQNLSNYQLQK